MIQKRQVGNAGHSDEKRWGPSVVSGPPPAEVTFNTAPVAALVSLNDVPSNFGHAIFDFLLPVFNTLSILGRPRTLCFVLHAIACQCKHICLNRISDHSLYSNYNSCGYPNLIGCMKWLCRNLPSKLSASSRSASGTYANLSKLLLERHTP